jgi:hypothetical protein
VTTPLPFGLDPIEPPPGAYVTFEHTPRPPRFSLRDPHSGRELVVVTFEGGRACATYDEADLDEGARRLFACLSELGSPHAEAAAACYDGVTLDPLRALALAHGRDIDLRGGIVRLQPEGIVIRPGDWLYVRHSPDRWPANFAHETWARCHDDGPLGVATRRAHGEMRGHPSTPNRIAFRTFGDNA